MCTKRSIFAHSIFTQLIPPPGVMPFNTSLPAYDWQKLRGNYPGQFEKPVIAAPAADQWFHARIVITHPRITVFINGAVEPCLAVDQLSDRTGGWIGFWAGNGSGGDFANLKITAAKPSLAGSLPK